MARPAGAPETGPDPAGGAAGPDGRHASGRPRLWSELLLVLVCYGVYEAVRNLVPPDPALAVHHAYELLHLEYLTHLDVEYRLNRLFMAHQPLAVAGDYFYATMHFAMTIGVLVWLYIQRPELYRSRRTLLFATTVLGLAGFWLYPLAPPRMLPGFTDTVASFGTWGVYASAPAASSVSNQYAAMPSMHVSWALWCAVVIIGVARRPAVKALAALYPALTTVAIMGTGNHYLLDAVAGAGALACGYALGLGLGAARAVLPGRSAAGRAAARRQSAAP
ncbi:MULTISPECIES: phosphatase PAP2 family protein [Thermomonosporaceae]|uniref:phosphatase PAP2 family protein n=1 Tax=Thermomonosporaceae TaxID=2012 RepID=UPI00255AA1D3|nr:MULTISPECIES: phosphatase PAP2 family protein [Thermomonosporaceae]MDL4771244.1 phosphatase PAP2 family protein [Actinomadura xylanilytica]